MNNFNPFYGTLDGDFIGSVYELNNIKTKDFPLIDSRCKLMNDYSLLCNTCRGLY